MLILTQFAAQKYLFYGQHCNIKTISGDKKNDFLEVSLLGICHEDKINLVTDWYCPKQEVTEVFTDIDKKGRADYLANLFCDFHDKNPESTDEECEAYMQRFNSVWAHTHPGKSPSPSGQDEATFSENYEDEKNVEFGVMLIMAIENFKVYNRMRYNTMFGPETNEKEVFVYMGGDSYKSLQNYFQDYFKLNDILGDMSLQSFYEDTSEFHAEWLSDLQEQVTEEIPPPKVTTKKNVAVGFDHQYHGKLKDYYDRYPGLTMDDQELEDKLAGWIPKVVDSNVVISY